MHNMCLFKIIGHFFVEIIFITLPYKFVLHFYMDVNLYTGIEYIYIRGFGKTNGTELDVYTSEYEEETVYDMELLYDTGNVSVKRTYDVSVIKENEFVEVMMDRVLQKKNVD